MAERKWTDEEIKTADEARKKAPIFHTIAIICVLVFIVGWASGNCESNTKNADQFLKQRAENRAAIVATQKVIE